MPAALFSSMQLDRLSAWWRDKLMTDTCTVQREVNSVYQTAATSPCALIDSPTPQTVKDITDETTGAVLKLVLFPRGFDVRSPDRLVINAILYRVYDIPDPGTFEVVRRVQVVRFPQRGAVS